MSDNSPNENTNCTSFDWNKQDPYVVTYPAKRISPAVTCPSRSNDSHACPIVAKGDDQLQWDYNISSILRDGVWNSDEGPMSFLFNLINSSIPTANETYTGTLFVESIIGNIDQVSEVPPGSSGYLEMSPYYQCYVGTVSNCTGDIDDGAGIEACAPLWHTTRTSDAFPVLDGQTSIHNVSAQNVSSYPDPFAGQSRGDAGSYAVALGGSVMWAGLASMTTIAIGGLIS